MEKMLKKPDYAKEILAIMHGSFSKEEMLDRIADYHENDIAEAFELLSESERKSWYQMFGPEQIAEIFSYIDDPDSYLKELPLDEAAKVLSFMDSDDAYLSRMFQKYAKINYKTYLQDIRMAYAYRDLLNTDHTISQIALDNGFCSSRGFSGEFQKRYGILPSEMRKQINEKGQKNAID